MSLVRLVVALALAGCPRLDLDGEPYLMVEPLARDPSASAGSIDIIPERARAGARAC